MFPRRLNFSRFRGEGTILLPSLYRRLHPAGTHTAEAKGSHMKIIMEIKSWNFQKKALVFPKKQKNYFKK